MKSLYEDSTVETTETEEIYGETTDTEENPSDDVETPPVEETEEVLKPTTWSALSIQEIKDHYLFGIDLSDQEGNPLPDSLFIHYIDAAVEYLQTLLDITISETEVQSESHDYLRSDYQNWGYIQLAHNPVKEIKGLRMMYGNRPSVEIPLDWIKLDKLTGQMHLFPSSGSAGSLIIGNTGLLYGFHGAWSFAPQLWEVDYVAGIDESDSKMPVALLREAIMKRASMGILNVWGRISHKYSINIA